MTVAVELDDEVRLATAVLAASQWPELEQQKKPHAVHAHSKQARLHFSPFAHLEAVRYVNTGLDGEKPLGELVGRLLQQKDELKQFKTESNSDSFWKAHEAVWTTAVSECAQIFANCPLPQLVNRMDGRRRAVGLMPTLTFPMLNPIVIEQKDRDLILLPPPKAWGESPPWPYSEDPIWVVVEAAKAIVSHRLRSQEHNLGQKASLHLIHAGVAQCLSQTFDAFEGKAYIVRAKKEYDIQMLPKTAERLALWLEGEEDTAVSTLIAN